MPTTRVGEYTRTLANGSAVRVHGHARHIDGGASGADRSGTGTTTGGGVATAGDADGRESSVQQRRRQRLKTEAQLRRANAARKARDSSSRGWARTKRQCRQSWRWTKSGGRTLRQAAGANRKRRRATAVALGVGGLAQIGGALMWSTAGAVLTAITILAATLGGALVLGRRAETA